ncbi:hypothetical protein NQZ79_g5008 [Umbelopsis isabellina]|nr:hypothetical protein NQZ79_g5008 [Umbelopsis isabellina]
MNFTGFEHETLASPELLKQQSYSHHQTYRQDAPSDLDFFSMVDNVMDPTNMSHEQMKQAFSANYKIMSHLPQLTPDNTEGNRTSSSVLSGHNPDYATMSPLHMPTNPENADEYHTPLQTSTGFRGHDDMMSMMDEENFFTPLVSPAITPVFNGGYSNSHMSNGMNNDMTFSPLSSPALHPLHQEHYFGDSPSASGGAHEENQSAEAILQRKLALIEQQQQQLRAIQQKMSYSSPNAISPVLQSTKRAGSSDSLSSGYPTNGNGAKRQATLRQKIAMSSPQFKGSVPHQTERRQSGGYQSVNVAHQSPVQYPHQHLEHPSMPPPPFQQQVSMSSQSPHALQPSSAPGSPSALAPATPASLMKLGGGRGSANNSGTSSPLSNPMEGNMNTIENMPELPDAILPMAAAPDMSASPMTGPRAIHSSPALPPSNKRKSSTRKNRKESFASPSIAPSPRMSITDPSIVMSPAALRPQVSQSPRALKPLISPSLKPTWPPSNNMVDQEAAAQILATKSNYQNLREGKIATLGMQFSPSIHSGIEIRRTAHKAAEQRRRDTLKKSFDCLRNEIVGSLVNEGLQIAAENEEAKADEAALRKDKEKEVKQMSKVVLLQHSFEYILRLKDDNRHKDDKLDRVMEKLRELRKQHGLPEITQEEEEEERQEREEEKRQRIARTERLANSQREDEEDNTGAAAATATTAPPSSSSTTSNEVEESE